MILSCFFCTLPVLHAASYSWRQGVSGTWGSAYFWNPDTGIPNGPGDSASISVSGSVPPDFVYDVTLDGNYALDSFSHGSGSANFSASGKTFTVYNNSNYSGGSMIFNSSTYSTGGIFTHSSGPFDLINGSISGAGSYNKTGGFLNMKNANVNVPATQSGGRILVYGNANFGAGLSNNGGTVELFGQTVAGANASLNLGSSDMTNAGTLRLTTENGGSYVPNLTIIGTGTLTNQPGGLIDIQLGEGGERSLDLELINQGTLAAATSFDISESGADHSNSGTISLSAGDLSVPNANSFTNSNLVSAAAGNITITGNNAVGSHFTNSAGSVTAAGTLQISNFRSIDNDGTLGAGGNLRLTNGTSSAQMIVDNAGGLSAGPAGSLTMTSAHGNSQLILQPGCTFASGTALNLSNTYLVLNRDLDLGTADLSMTNGGLSGSGTLTRGAGSSATLSAVNLTAPMVTAGNSTFSGSSNIRNAFTNQAGGTLDLNAGTSLKIDAEDLVNEGRMNLLSGNGSIQLNAYNTSSSTGGLVNMPGATVLVEGIGARYFDVPVDNRGQFTLNTAARWNRTGATQLNAGTVTAAARFDVSSAREFHNTGDVTSTGGLLFFDGDNDAAAFTNSSTSTITVENGMTVQHFTTVTNDGLIDVNGGTLQLNLSQRNNPHTFHHNGSIGLASGTTVSIYRGFPYAGGTFRIADGATLDGGGAININAISLVLDGDYDPGTSPLSLTNLGVSGTGSLTIQPGNTLAVSGVTFSVPVDNQGTTTYSGTQTVNGILHNTSTLNLNPGTYLKLDNEDLRNEGMLHLLEGAGSIQIHPKDAATSTGGLVNLPAGTVTVEGTGPRYFDVAVDNQGQFTLNSAARWNRTGVSHTNSGTVTAAARFDVTNAREFHNTGNVTSTGGLLFFDGDNDAASTFTNSSIITVENGMTLQNFKTLINDSLIDVDNGTLKLNLSQRDNPQTFHHNGTIDLAPGTTASIYRGYPYTGGTLRIADGATLDGGGAINLNAISLVLDGPYSPGTSPLSLVNLGVSGDGSLTIDAGNTLAMNGTTVSTPLVNNGEITHSATIDMRGSYQNNATVELNPGSYLKLHTENFINEASLHMLPGTGSTEIHHSNATTSTASLINMPNGTVTVDGTGVRNFEIPVDNRGLFALNDDTNWHIAGMSHQNSGTITAAGNFTVSNALDFTNTGTITSTGGALLFDGNNTADSDFLNAGTITVENGMTLQGFKTITNDSLIDLNNGTLRLNLSQRNNPQAFHHNGTIDLAPGSTVSMFRGYPYTGGTFQIANGATLDGGGAITLNSISLVLDGSYSPGTSPMTLTSCGVSGTGSLTIEAGSTLTLANSTIGVPLDNQGTIAHTGSPVMTGGYHNTSTVDLHPGTDLRLHIEDFVNEGDLHFLPGTGNSEISYSNASTSTASLINLSTGIVTVDGTGVRNFEIPVDNRGLFALNDGTNWNIAGMSHQNSGTINAGGNFTVTNALDFTNTGTITSTGGSLNFSGNSAAESDFFNTGTITVENGMTLQHFKTLTNDSLIDVNNGTLRLKLSQRNNPHTFHHNGTIDLAPGSTVSMYRGYQYSAGTFQIADGATLDGGGAITLNSISLVLDGVYSPGTSPLTLTSCGVSGTGSLTIEAGSTLAMANSTVSVPLTNQGHVTHTGQPVIHESYLNQGTVDISTGCYLRIHTNDFINEGDLHFLPGTGSSEISYSNASTSTASLINMPTGTVTVDGTGVRNFEIPVDNRGLFALNDDTNWNIAGKSHQNSGTITANGSFTVANALHFANSGTVTSTGGALDFDGNSAADSDFLNAGTIAAVNGLTIRGFETGTNDGTIELGAGTFSVLLGHYNNPQSFTNQGTIDLAAGTTMSLSGYGNGTASNAAGATISGNGTLNRVNGSFTNHGILQPGQSVGILHVTGDLANTTTAEFPIEITGNSGPGTGHDQILVTGNIALSGTLQPQLLGGFIPAPSDRFVILKSTGGDVTGTFSAVEQPFAGLGVFNVTVDEDNDEVVLTFTQTGPLDFEDFQQLYFTAAEIANGNGTMDGDWDGDGLVNLLEWIHGFDPTMPDLTLPPVRAAIDNSGFIELTYPESIRLPEDTVSVAILQTQDPAGGFNPLPATDYTRLTPLVIPGYDNIQWVTLRITNPAWSTLDQCLFQLRFTAPTP